MTVRSPIKWVGGKFKIRKRIHELLPPNGLYTCYVEVFGGAGWVLFGKNPSPVEILNDIDGELINFFKVLQTDINRLIKEFCNYPLVSRSIYSSLLETDPTKLDEISRAHRFYYILMASWGGEWDVPRMQTSITDAGKGNRLIGALRALRQRLYPVHERLSKVIIENLDWRECVEKYDNEKTVMYFDPPYPQNNCNYNFNMRSFSEHVELSEKLSYLRSRWILTSYDKKEIRKLFRNFHILPVEFASGMDSNNGRRNKEIIITNYDPIALTKEYEQLSQLSGIPDIGLGDEVILKRGRLANTIGKIEGFNNSHLIIKSNNDKFIKAKASNIKCRKRKFFSNSTQTELLNLKKEAGAGLNIQAIQLLYELAETGHISDPVEKINEILINNLTRITNKINGK